MASISKRLELLTINKKWGNGFSASSGTCKVQREMLNGGITWSSVSELRSSKLRKLFSDQLPVSLPITATRDRVEAGREDNSEVFFLLAR